MNRENKRKKYDKHYYNKHAAQILSPVRCADAWSFRKEQDPAIGITVLTA